MGRAPCCDKSNVKKGPWSLEEDTKLKDYIEKHGTGGNWITLPKKVGLIRCGKSCRLRWLNYLRPNIKHGEFSDSEDNIICTLFATTGSRWSIIASKLQGRTDNDVKNYWNTKLKKKFMSMNHYSKEMKSQQVTLLSPSISLSFAHSNNNSSHYHDHYSNGSSLKESFSFSYSSSLLSATQESPIGSNQKFQFKNQSIHVMDQEGIEGCGNASFVEQNVGDVNYFYNGFWDENLLDYSGSDEIKELISITCNTSNCNNFLFDE